MATQLTVRLTKAGEALAKGNALSIHTGHFSGSFRAGVEQSVSQEDWLSSLATTVIAGAHIFEIVPEPPPPISKGPTKPVAAPTT